MTYSRALVNNVRLDCYLGVKELMEYMKKEYSHENLRFWGAVQELRYGPGTEAKIKKKVKEIWE